MQYQVSKVFNNNVVLAQDASGKQVVLIGKGIGFGVKKGSPIDGDLAGQKVFSILDGDLDPSQLKRMNYDIERVEQVTREIVSVAKDNLGITNENLYDALYDHISFAIERMKIGLPIENPFITEIGVMCAREYQVAEQAAELLKNHLDVNIGDAEKGFIALHLYSARRNKHINAAMKNVRLYQQALEVIEAQFGRDFDGNSTACRGFLMTLNRLANASLKGRLLNLPVKQYVRLNMGDYYKTAQIIAGMLEQDAEVKLSEDAKSFLAVAICQLIQV